MLEVIEGLEMMRGAGQPKPAAKNTTTPKSSLLTGDPVIDAKLAPVLGINTAPAAAPATPAAPASRSSSTDQALEEERRLWDEAVAKYGVEVVTREVGRRP
jgi:hypothetical protein